MSEAELEEGKPLLEPLGEPLGIMGGAFNPPHIGHLVAALEAAHRFGLTRLILVPSGNPPHKSPHNLLPREMRYRLCCAAVQDEPLFEVSRLEIDRPGISYTVHTLQYFKKAYPRRPLYFISGADAVLEILNWKEPETVFSLASFVAATRPGHPLDTLHAQIKKLKGAKVHILEIPNLGISSTLLRTRIARGLPIRYLVPDAVAHLIESENLYREGLA